MKRKRTKTRVEIKYTLYQLERMLKPREKRFCLEYIKNGWCAYKAWMRVYPKSKRKSAEAASSKKLSNHKIKQFIDYKRESFEEIVGMSKARQLQQYIKIGYSNMAHLNDSWVELKDWDAISDDDKICLEVIETKTEQGLTAFKEPIEIKYVKIKLVSKIAAMTRIDKLMGYEAVEKISVTVEQPLFPDV